LGKLLKQGSIKIGDEDVPYEIYRDGRLSSGDYQCYIVGGYRGEHIEIYDHGFGIDHVIALFKNQILIIKNK